MGGCQGKKVIEVESKCSLPIDKLNEKRNEFWSTVDNHSHPHYQIWRIINQACLYDECKYEYI